MNDDGVVDDDGDGSDGGDDDDDDDDTRVKARDGVFIESGRARLWES